MDLFDILLVKKLIGKVSSGGTTDEELQEIIKQLKEKVSKDEMELYVTNTVADAVATIKPLDVQSDWKQTDETAMDFIKNKPIEVTFEDVLEYMTSENIVNPVASNTNSLYTNNDGKIYTL